MIGWWRQCRVERARKRLFHAVEDLLAASLADRGFKSGRRAKLWLEWNGEEVSLVALADRENVGIQCRKRDAERTLIEELIGGYLEILPDGRTQPKQIGSDDLRAWLDRCLDTMS
jgi:hypothetical protein